MQSGFMDQWWPEAMTCYCFLRNCYDLLKGEVTAYQKRFGVPFRGPYIPFGAEIQYKPISRKDKKRLPAFGTGLISGIFVGYDQGIGGLDRRLISCGLA